MFKTISEGGGGLVEKKVYFFIKISLTVLTIIARVKYERDWRVINDDYLLCQTYTKQNFRWGILITFFVQ